MAQSVEQLICNLQVMGSSPFTSSRKKQKALTEISVRAFFVPMRHLPAGPFCEVSRQDVTRQIILCTASCSFGMRKWETLPAYRI